MIHFNYFFKISYVGFSRMNQEFITLEKGILRKFKRGTMTFEVFRWVVRAPVIIVLPIAIAILLNL